MTPHPPRPRLRLAVVLLLAASGLFPRPAAAAEVAWTVAPADNQFGAGRQSFGYTLNPGGQVQDGVVVVNHGAAPLHVALRAADALTTPQGRIGLVAPDAPAKGLGAWVRLDRTDVTVKPGASVVVPFAVTLPTDAAPGDYVGGIAADRRAAVQIRLRVGGALMPSLAVEHVGVDYAGSPDPFRTGSATVSYTIHNTGNAILTAHQAVSVSAPFGRWAAAANRMPDSPPLLPGASWTVSAPVHGVAPAVRLTATVALIPLLTDAAGSTAPLAAVKASGHAWTVPWALLLAVVVVCGLVVAAVRRRRRTARS